MRLVGKTLKVGLPVPVSENILNFQKKVLRIEKVVVHTNIPHIPGQVVFTRESCIPLRQERQ